MKNIKTPLRKIAGSLLAGAFMAGAANAAPVQTGNTIQVTTTPGRVNDGGAFTISGGTYAGPSFETFCLERSEHIGLGGTYTVTLNTSAIKGGDGVRDNSGAGIGGTPGVSDPLSSKTAWLYSQFLAGGGALTGWSTTGLTAGQRSGEVQKAIWYLEDEIAKPTSGYAKTWVDQALSTATSGLYDIRVMNLTASDGLHQDLLAPVPEPGTYAMFLAGLGLMAGIARRRRAS
jgi:hypothetical protein